MSDGGERRIGFRCQVSGDGGIRMRKSECGMRPPASPSSRLYEPEAVGAIGAYAAEGRRKKSRSYRLMVIS
jgi:hypothetical protein